jgi:hypothetical protein
MTTYNELPVYKATLQTAREHIEVISLLVRLTKDMQQIGLKRFVEAKYQAEREWVLK